MVKKKNPPAIQEMQEMWVQSLGQENSQEEEMAPYSSILAWKYSWTKEAVGLQSMGLQREAKSRAPPNCYYYCECQTCNLSVAY